MQATTLQKLRVPAAMLALTAIVLLPSFFASAAEADAEQEKRHARPPAIGIEITSVTDNGDGSGVLEGQLVDVPERLTENKGVESGDSVTVNFTDETKMMLEREEVSISAFNVGDTVFALGPIDFDESSIDAKALVDQPHKKGGDERGGENKGGCRGEAPEQE
jgi:hypothetical protein